MDTSKIKIELVNYDLGFSSPPRLVQGYSGKSYGLARFSHKHNAHMLTLTLDEYNKAARDLSKAWHQTLRRWVPLFVVEEVAEATVSAPKPAATTTATVVHPTNPIEPVAPVVTKRPPVEIPAELPPKYFGLCALAKKLEIDPEQFKGDKPGLISAIESKRLQPA